MKNPAQYALCLDVGGSHVTAAPIDLSHRTLLNPGRVRAPVHHVDAAETILQTWWSALSMASLACENKSFSHITLALPAPFDYQHGISRMTHKYRQLFGLDVRALLQTQQQFSPLAGLPIFFANDADLFALGEHWAGMGQPFERMIGVTLGTGLGSGFVREGKIIRSGPEVPPEGELWNTPHLDGLAERHACGQAVSDSYGLLTGESCSAEEISLRADQGDLQARSAFQTLGEHLVAILTPHVQAFEAQAVVVGGNVSRAWKHFGPALQEGLPGAEVFPSQLREDAALLGGAALLSPAGVLS
ncbi:ROK family protein [Deinococcus roseus]|uniref:Glucokinase n=1 Tax=Deinococcus roseus TaxID=392414 RepID=A0ABQ2DJU2_9DEIO|nr:ROK family protein [Deinococcus roseus]GGJ59978.1 glucokinase [Deinococcus roseus]